MKPNRQQKFIDDHPLLFAIVDWVMNYTIFVAKVMWALLIIKLLNLLLF